MSCPALQCSPTMRADIIGETLIGQPAVSIRASHFLGYDGGRKLAATGPGLALPLRCKIPPAAPVILQTLHLFFLSSAEPALHSFTLPRCRREVVWVIGLCNSPLQLTFCALVPS